MNRKLKKADRSKPIRLGFDLDGVICNFTDEFVYRLNEQLLRDGRAEDTVQMPLRDYWFLNDHLDFFYQEIRNGLFADLVPFPEAIVYISDLLERPEYELFFITARGSEGGMPWEAHAVEKLKVDTRNWLNLYFPKANTDHLFFCGQKDRFILEHKLDAFVEDRADAAKRFTNITNSFILKQSWNEFEDFGEAIQLNALVELDLFLKHL